MAKIWQISDGRSYVVNGDPGTTITYTNSTSNGTAAGKQAASIPAGATSVTFISNGSEVEISQDTATIDQVFNAAAAGAGSSSGGSGSAGGVSFQIVTTLPDQGAAGVIYLVKVSETGDDKFEEWIWVDSAWESIGTTAVDPTTYAKLVGGNDFTGNQTVQGDVTVNGSLTVTGDSSGIVDNNYNLVETADSTITPQAGTWTRYTGSETALTIEEPAWTGDVDLAYLETTVPVTLTGVTWSPAAPVLTGDGPFVYTLVHSKEGEVLAGAYGYSTPTAEAVQAVVPMSWGTWTTKPDAYNKINSIALGHYARTKDNYSVALGSSSLCNQSLSVAVGHNTQTSGLYTLTAGVSAVSKKTQNITIGFGYNEKVDNVDFARTCTTEGTGSITIGAGANTKNPVKADGTPVLDSEGKAAESSNSVTIGCKAENNSADNVVIGAQATATIHGANVVIGAKAGNNGADESNISYNCVVVGNEAKSSFAQSVSVGSKSKSGLNSVALGFLANSLPNRVIAIGASARVDNTGTTKSENSAVIGYGARATAPNALTFGALFSETIDGETVTNYCKTEGAGSITIGAGASTLNTTKTVDGVETTVESSNSITIGCKASNTGADSVVIGASASNTYIINPNVVIGAKSMASGSGGCVAIGGRNTVAGLDVAVGFNSKAGSGNSVAVGADANTLSSTKTIAIGSSATITNTTNADGSVTKSENTTVIGYGASASAPNAVVLGAGASNSGSNSVVLGASSSNEGAGNVLVGGEAVAKGTCNVNIGYKTNKMTGSNNVAIGYYTNSGDSCVSIGSFTTAANNGVSLGRYAHSNVFGVALGDTARAEGSKAVAIGSNAKVADNGATVIRSTAADDTYTQLYFSGANTPLANTYENGEAMMGYVVSQKTTDETGKTVYVPVAAGTQKLSVLFPNNSTFQPAMLGLDDDYTPPKVFHPADLDMPNEEPQEPTEPESVEINIPEPEMEEYQPIPVYPVVESEMQEPEEYAPLPVYPIVEPEVPGIQEPTEDQ